MVSFLYEITNIFKDQIIQKKLIYSDFFYQQTPNYTTAIEKWNIKN